MKRMQGIWILVFVMSLFVIQADLGWGDEGHADKKNPPAASKEKTKSGRQQEAASNCPPGLNGELPSSTEQAAGIDNQTTGRRDQAVGNDSPLTKNSNEEIDAGHFPCPPASTDKGAGSSGKAPSKSKGDASTGKSKSSADKGGDQKPSEQKSAK
ncbi:MAG: hypothetical protein EPO39_00810 [Candidatus Manganitrophaceae bacterium]|nr:MAG: hypothetical protein EPO39_00810 [Candidatus Manganitrophaceae bacterium]